MLNRRSRISKNANPYKNNQILKDSKYGRRSSQKISLLRKSKELKPNINKLNKESSVLTEEQKIYRIAIKKNSARLSDNPGSHREKQSIDDYSKVLKNFGVSGGDRAVRNQVHELDTNNQFMRNMGNFLHSRKPQ